MTSEQLTALQQLNELALTEQEAGVVLQCIETMQQQETLLEQIDTANTDVMVHVMPMTNVVRDDVRKQPFAREDLLAGAPEHTDDSWQVPRLVK